MKEEEKNTGYHSQWWNPWYLERVLFFYCAGAVHTCIHVISHPFFGSPDLSDDELISALSGQNL